MIKHLILLFAGSLLTSALGDTPQSSSSNENLSVQDDQLALGFSYKKPIIIEALKNDVELRALQENFMKDWDYSYKTGMSWLTLLPSNRLLQAFSLSNEKGERVVMYFDITETAKSYRQFLDKQFKDEVKEVLKVGPITLKSIKKGNKIPWKDLKEADRELIWEKARQQINTEGLKDNFKKDLLNSIPKEDIPLDIKKELSL